VIVAHHGRMTTIDHQIDQANVIASTRHDRKSPKSPWASMRASYRDRRATRAMHSAIERELSTYTTPAELLELESMFERCDSENDTVYGEMIQRVLMRSA
jgi:hypothetical protein